MPSPQEQRHVADCAAHNLLPVTGVTGYIQTGTSPGRVGSVRVETPEMANRICTVVKPKMEVLLPHVTKAQPRSQSEQVGGPREKYGTVLWMGEDPPHRSEASFPHLSPSLVWQTSSACSPKSRRQAACLPRPQVLDLTVLANICTSRGSENSKELGGPWITPPGTQNVNQHILLRSRKSTGEKEA